MRLHGQLLLTVSQADNKLPNNLPFLASLQSWHDYIVEKKGVMSPFLLFIR